MQLLVHLCYGPNANSAVITRWSLGQHHSEGTDFALLWKTRQCYFPFYTQGIVVKCCCCFALHCASWHSRKPCVLGASCKKTTCTCLLLGRGVGSDPVHQSRGPRCASHTSSRKDLHPGHRSLCGRHKTGGLRRVTARFSQFGFGQWKRPPLRLHAEVVFRRGARIMKGNLATQCVGGLGHER